MDKEQDVEAKDELDPEATPGDETKPEDEQGKDEDAEQNDSDESGDGDDTDPDAEGKNEEADVVLESSGSQPSKANITRGVQKRINHLNERNNETTSDLEKRNQQLADKEAENRVLRSLVNKQTSGDTPPQKAIKPDQKDFDKYPDGASDDAYVADYEKYRDLKLDERFDKESKNDQERFREDAGARSRNSQASEFQVVQTKHYTQAEESGLKEYNKVEDQALENMGRHGPEIYQHILSKFPKTSHNVMFYLGKNREAAERIVDGLEADLVDGAMALRDLERDLKFKPKFKKTPDPDEELPGGTPNAGKADTKSEKMLEKAIKSGNPNEFLEHERQKREKAALQEDG